MRPDGLGHYSAWRMRHFRYSVSGRLSTTGWSRRGATAFQQAHPAPRVHGCRGDGAFQIGPADVMGAGTGDQQSMRRKHFEGAQVQFLIAAQCALDGALRLGEGGRIKHDGVEFLAGIGPVAQDLKGVSLRPSRLRLRFDCDWLQGCARPLQGRRARRRCR